LSLLFVLLVKTLKLTNFGYNYTRGVELWYRPRRKKDKSSLSTVTELQQVFLIMVSWAVCYCHPLLVHMLVPTLLQEALSPFLSLQQIGWGTECCKWRFVQD